MPWRRDGWKVASSGSPGPAAPHLWVYGVMKQGQSVPPCPPSIFRSMGDKAEVTPWGFMQYPWQGRKGPRKPTPHAPTVGQTQDRDAALLPCHHLRAPPCRTFWG